MKRAFLQALFLFCLLGLTWLILFLRFRDVGDSALESRPPIDAIEVPALGDEQTIVGEEADPAEAEGFRKDQESGGADAVPSGMSHALGREILALEAELNEGLRSGMAAERFAHWQSDLMNARERLRETLGSPSQP